MLNPQDKAQLFVISIAVVLLIVGLFVFYLGRQADKYDEIKREETYAAGNNKTKNNSDHAKDEFDYDKILSVEKDDDVIHAQSDKYDWCQTENEIEAFIHLKDFDSHISGREIDVVMTMKHLKVIVQRKLLIDQDFFANIKPDDSFWTLSKDKDGNPFIWLTISKAVPTQRNHHWKSVLKGDQEINVDKLGPTLRSVDPNDPASIKKAVAQVNHFLSFFLSFSIILY